MFKALTFLTVLPQLSYAESTHDTCIPNTQILLKDRVCECDSTGRWTDEKCLLLGRRQACEPGKVTWQGCHQCICQENSQLICNSVGCLNDEPAPTTQKVNHKGLRAVGERCTPFRTYYIDCSICVCPKSGLTSAAICARDTSCPALKTPDFTDLFYKNNGCLSKVMYLFPCLHCLCADEGVFKPSMCTDTCQRQKMREPQKCTPKSFYRKDCNVCLCSKEGVRDDRSCTGINCSESPTYKVIKSLRMESKTCVPYQFTTRRCLYCDCQRGGTVNEHACIEIECQKTVKDEYVAPRNTCRPGEMVPSCIECFCLQNGTTTQEYCTNSCSRHNKILILENVVKENNINDNLINWEALEKLTNKDICDFNAVYVEAKYKNRLCLCFNQSNGKMQPDLCTTIEKKEFDFKNPKLVFKENVIRIDFNATCEPSTFVEFECNTCFCSKKGKIDPKWCTYDDCDAKKRIQDSQKLIQHLEKQNGKCVPGSLSKVHCNYCICPSTGLTNERACTKNHCSSFDAQGINDKFTCEALSYYEVDCNICFCPRDGLQNVAKCTKNLCEKNFLRTEVCVPEKLFIDDCNVCVCPSNGVKADKACTAHDCPYGATAWKKIFKLSQTLLGNQVTEDSTRNLDVCFPGEEFLVGCKLCVCPDMGLRSYATCTQCDDENKAKGVQDSHVYIDRQSSNYIEPKEEAAVEHPRARRYDCKVFNISKDNERQDCTAGSMYIIKCQQCICPYMGNINNFCRPLPPEIHCEQAYPNYNFVPMGRRVPDDNTTTVITNSTNANETRPADHTIESNKTASTNEPSGTTDRIREPHSHTEYRCEKPGKIMDKCFICDCEDTYVLIREHCFKSDNEECATAEPLFVNENKLKLE